MTADKTRTGLTIPDALASLSADPELVRIVEAMAHGFQLVDHADNRDFDGHEYWIEKCEGFPLKISIDRLISFGIIEPHSGYASGWRLADKWYRAYMRSTDELGDGRLHVPEVVLP